MHLRIQVDTQVLGTLNKLCFRENGGTNEF